MDPKWVCFKNLYSQAHESYMKYSVHVSTGSNPNELSKIKKKTILNQN